MKIAFARLHGHSLRASLVSCIGCFAMLTSPGFLQAAPIAVPNFSFEATAPNDGNFDSAPIPDWTITGTYAQAGAYNSTNVVYTGTTGNPLPAPGDGNNFGLSNLNRSTSAGSNNAVFTSAASLASVQDNTQYTLTVAVGNRLVYEPDEVTIALLVDDVVVPGASLTFLGSAIADDSFAEFTTSFSTAYVGDPLTGGALKIQLSHSTLAGSSIATADFDNIRLDASLLPPPPVPEPSALVLLSLGAMGLVKLRRRHQGRRNG